MSHVLIVHHVADYPAWKKIFDEAADLRRAAGEMTYQVLRHRGDDCNIVHFARWRDLDAARAFFESAELVAIRAKAGVAAPEFHYLEEVAAGSLI